MASRPVLAALVCAAVLLFPLGARGVIHAPRSSSHHGGLIEPRTFEISEEGGELRDAFGKAAGHSLHKRQAAETSGIGTLFPLTGDSHTQAVVHWTGYPSEAFFILTRRRSSLPGRASLESWLWRSTDYGNSYVNETSKWDNDTIIEWYYVSPLSEYLIFADTTHNKLWVTRDEGETYSGYQVPFTPDKIRFQGTSVPNSTQQELARLVLGYDQGEQTLWVSTNLGETWVQVGTGVLPNRYYWRVLNETMEDLTAVYFEETINATHSQLKVSVTPYTSSDLVDPTLKAFLSNTFVLAHEYMFVQTNVTVGSSAAYESPLWVSRYRRPFQQAEFPQQNEERHYWVADASEGQVFMAVYHSFDSTNLYLSEEAGLSYALSLEYIVSPDEADWIDGDPTFDVHVVEGISGTYIANRKIPGTDLGGTVISFDKGGVWSLITAPATDTHGIPLSCDPPECSLHLHMDLDRSIGYKSILSQDSAIGLIMAQGNIGSVLLDSRLSRDDDRLYFSHDGGFTWQTVASGLWDFQFAAIGSIVATVSWRSAPISNVRWSCDEGGSWNITRFANNNISIVGMLTEIGERAQHVTIFGYNSPFTEWLIVDLNFTLVVPEQCNPDTDYYDWRPTDERPDQRCLLGETTVYERRRSDVCCYIDPFYERPVSRVSCVCAIEDFECDFGFERLNLNSPCTPLQFFPWPPAPPNDCPEGANYSYTSGYRLVAEDRCIRGNETYFFPTVRPCPIKPPLGLVLSTDPPAGTIFPGTDVTFTLTQLLGGVLSTVYMWDFGDGSPVVTATGLVNAAVQMHSFTRPGVYAVHITASNQGGSSERTFPVTVLDYITSYNVTLPVQLRNGQVPTGITLVFQAHYFTQYDSNLTSSITYFWQFDDQTTLTTDDSTVTFAYPRPGNYTFRLLLVGVSVRAPDFSEDIMVFLAADSVTIQSPGLITDPLGGTFAIKGKELTLTVVDNDKNERIPADTMYSWYIVPFSGQSGGDFSQHQDNPELSHNFTQVGSYHVSVVGNYSSGSFHNQIRVFVECELVAVAVTSDPTVRSGQPTTIHLSFTPVCVYSDLTPIQLTATYDTTNGTTQVATGLLRPEGGGAMLDVILTSPNVSLALPVLFSVYNHVSNIMTTVSIPVLLRGSYGELRLVFKTTDLPGGGVNGEWQEKLKDSIKLYINIKYDVDLKRIAFAGIMFEYNSTQYAQPPPTTNGVKGQEVKGDSNLLRKRRALVDVLLVDVVILPTAFSDEAIDEAKKVVKLLVNASASGSLSFTVDGETVVVSDAVARRTTDPVVIIIEPGRVDGSRVRQIGIGVGLLAVTVVVFVVVLVVVIFLYQKKYSRLRVRYSRLQQSPVRFTFTQAGEMVENEDEDFEDDAEMDEHRDSDEEDKGGKND